MENLLVSFLGQLAVQAPSLLAYLVGIILALVFWRRCPGPSLLTLLALALLLVTSLVQTFLLLYLFRARADFGWDEARVGWMLSASALVGSVIRAAALGLLLAAVFLGRRGTPRTGPASRQPDTRNVGGADFPYSNPAGGK
jgi:hypothetical protein